MVDAVYEGMRKINSAGTALLIVEQQVDRVLDIAGTAVVLEHGSVAYNGSADGALVAIERVLASRGERAATDAGGTGGRPWERNGQQNASQRETTPDNEEST